MNIGINGLVGGIGALINKKPSQKIHKVVFKGFGQGCLGGTFQTIGKSLTYQIGAKQNLSYGWAARITNSIGNSITQNAANNDNFWEHWHFNLGVIRFDYSVKNKKFRARLFPSSIFGIITAAKQAELDLKSSLQSSVLIYKRDGFVSLLGRPALGFGVVSSIAYDRNIQGQQYYELMAHEMMHILQYENLVWINPMLKKVDAQLKLSNTIYKNLSKYLYFDLNGLTFFGLYSTELNKDWQCRHIEREAEFFSRKITYPKCN